MIEKHLKKIILCLNLKLGTELNVGGTERKFQKKLIIFLKWVVKICFLCCYFF